MGLSDDELRSMIRASIVRLASEGTVVESFAGQHAGSAPLADPAGHISFARFVLQGEGDDGGPCVIEPTVRCNHCGYCRSYGH